MDLKDSRNRLYLLMRKASKEFVSIYNLSLDSFLFPKLFLLLENVFLFYLNSSNNYSWVLLFSPQDFTNMAFSEKWKTWGDLILTYLNFFCIFELQCLNNNVSTPFLHSSLTYFLILKHNLIFGSCSFKIISGNFVCSSSEYYFCDLWWILCFRDNDYSYLKYFVPLLLQS